MNDLIPLVQQCIHQVAEERQVSVPEDLGPHTRLFGRGGVFDSLGLVSLIVAVEEVVADSLDVQVSLADERAMSEKKSPFIDVASLAAYVQRLVDETR